ncbi:hypothetical protein SAMN05216480_10557 [Pustulibacterium marinum]|uniref:Uncharacterized protein n=1 Tax=Pustulibacterium marinum TaxID=1224947 RepID=A0A1I7GLD7_9FLAO|nr:hypothetical protein [Pustulibacterium marinum]SFU49260.1 hypothetical protein SAMN05216480_10557 [Pustulibacterium marinum]
MGYDHFTNNKTFSLASVNVACNKLIDYLELKFADEIKRNSIGLTGNSARALTGLNVEVKCISFITASEMMYKDLVKSIDDVLSGSSKLVYKDRIQYKLKETYLEVWFSSSAVSFQVLNNIQYQTISEIPENIN